MEWQPIEAAPKDGTRVVLWCMFDDGGEPTIAYWVDNPSRGAAFGDFVWRELGGSAVAEKVPTHWMPLPKGIIYLTPETLPGRYLLVMWITL
jgi:hypothetical protein